MKLGVITDGINTDLEHALRVMNETVVEYAELQFIWDKEIGDQTEDEIQKAMLAISRMVSPSSSSASSPPDSSRSLPFLMTMM